MKEGTDYTTQKDGGMGMVAIGDGGAEAVAKMTEM